MTEAEAVHAARFFERVRIGRGPNACWLWQGARQSQKRRPYGLFEYEDDHGQRRRIVAHKFAFQLSGGIIRDGEEVGHTCHRSLCVRFGHLESTDHPTNTKHTWRPDGPRRQKKRKADARKKSAAVVL